MATAAQKAGRALLALAAILAICLLAANTASAGPVSTRIVHTAGEIVPIPAAIPHEEGDMVDSRIVPDLRWISQHYSIYVTDGYSGPLANGEHVGCNNCHVRGSDHYNGVAVDLVPLNGTSGTCDATWAGITRLALWAEPVQNKPVLPFRWVGYDGDAGHGCGNHLHLSWNHAPAARYELAEWVEVFPVAGLPRKPRPPRPTPPKAPETPPPAPKAPPGPPPGVGTPTGPAGGISSVRAGGLSPRGD